MLQRALDKDPHRRWRSVEAFRRALERVRVGEEIPTRILIADDDEDWRTLLHDALQPRFPDEVIDLVSDGEQAIAAFEKNPYSVVLVDLQTALPSARRRVPASPSSEQLPDLFALQFTNI